MSPARASRAQCRRCAGGRTAQLQINGRGGVPATGVAAVVLNVTAVSPTDVGYLTGLAVRHRTEPPPRT